MDVSKTMKRVRDPVHGLIVFRDNPVDTMAWQLIDTPEFQRLRRIRQLGVSELTFPGAVHTRFAHSIGVFHNARRLVEIIRREIGVKSFNGDLADVALIAALLHDVGHGPFSHTFESVQDSRGVKKRHEQWTADIIRNPQGRIHPILEAFRPGFSQEVAGLLEKEDPENIYHAVVSSSFDADRLDYLQRDKLMTGTGAGGIDFDWLLDNLTVAEIEIDAPDEAGEAEQESRRVPTFCLRAKALQAAEQFLQARFALHQQVYLHKTTRCVEQVIGKLLGLVAVIAQAESDVTECGLSPNHPLIRFFGEGGETIETYLALDDHGVLGALHELKKARNPEVSELAIRLLERDLYKTLDLEEFGSDPGRQRQKLRRIKSTFEDAIRSGRVMIDDRASVGIYTEIAGDDARMHKKLHILDGGRPREISELSRLIELLGERKKNFVRIFFEQAADRDHARRQ